MDYKGCMGIFNPTTSFDSDNDNYADQSFQFGVFTADCDSRCHTHRISGHSVDFDIGIGTKLLTKGLDLPTGRPSTNRNNITATHLADDARCFDASTDSLTSATIARASVEGVGSKNNDCPCMDNRTMSTCSLDEIDEKYRAYPIWRSLDRDGFKNSELPGIGTGDHVHPILRSLDNVNMEGGEMSGIGAGCRVDLMNRGQIFQKWCASRTPCMFLSILLLGICSISFSYFVTRLVSEVILEKQVDFRTPMMNFTTESISFLCMQEILRDVDDSGKSFISTPEYREYTDLQILQDNANDSQQRYLALGFRPISAYMSGFSSDRSHRGISTNYTCRAITISFLTESLFDVTRKQRLSTLGLVFSAWGQISGTVHILESGHIPAEAVQVHPTWKSGDLSDLDGSVPSGVGDGSLVQLMIRRLICAEFNLCWYLCLFVSILLTGLCSACGFSTYRLLNALCMVRGFVQSSFTNAFTGTDDSRFRLLLRARVAVGLKRIERVAYCELIQLHNCHAPLLYLEASRELSCPSKLCKIMKDASLSELSYLYNASESISRKVEDVLSQNFKYVKQQRLWEKISYKFNQAYFDDSTIEGFQIILLLLSLFENTEEDIRTVILYGVPGFPSISLSSSATYAKIRSIFSIMLQIWDISIL